MDGNRFLLTRMIKGFPSYISTIKSNLQKPLTTINGVESKPKEALLALGMEKYSIIQASIQASINDALQKKFKRIDTLASYVFISLVSFNNFFLLFPHASFHQLSLNNHNTVFVFSFPNYLLGLDNGAILILDIQTGQIERELSVHSNTVK